MKGFNLFQRLKLAQSFKQATPQQLEEIIELVNKEKKARKKRVAKS